MYTFQGFKLSRKARDPAKEMAEWKKIKGLVRKPHKGELEHIEDRTWNLTRGQESTVAIGPSNALSHVTTPFLPLPSPGRCEDHQHRGGGNHNHGTPTGRERL